MLSEPQNRHYTRWPILGINVGTPEVNQPTSYSGEIIKFKNWINERLIWLDANMPGNCPNVSVSENKKTYLVTYPNPSSNIVNVYSEASIKNITLFDNVGRLIFKKENICSKNFQMNVSDLHGFFTFKIELSNKEVINKNIITY